MVQIAVLEEQKRMMVVKKENEPTTGSDQSAVKHTNNTHEKQGKFNMNEILEETKVTKFSGFNLWSWHRILCALSHFYHTALGLSFTDQVT